MQIEEALTFDDVTLVPQFSEVMPADIGLATNLTPNIQLNIPIVSAAMDTVTEHFLAIALAREGGIGVIHKNMSIADQAKEVKRVKKAESGMILTPITVSPETEVEDIIVLMKDNNISGIPVVQKGNKLVGLVTKRDVSKSRGLRAQDVMSTDLVTAQRGVSIEDAQIVLHQNRVEKLPVVEEDSCLYGMITQRDLNKITEFPLATKDDQQRLRVAAAVGTDGSTKDRVAALVQAGVDAVVVDSAHADSRNVHDTIKMIKEEYEDVSVVVGNVATPGGVERLAKLGVDAVKVGIGAGAICTTRVVTGVGVPQVSAIWECSQAARNFNVPLIADGGLRNSGDIVKALAAGASSVMIGSMLAGTTEAPGEEVLKKEGKCKVFRGMGSVEAMKEGSGDRYNQDNNRKFVPEGVESVIPYKGDATDTIFQLVGGTSSGMGYLGCPDIKSLQRNAVFRKVTLAGYKEGHPHNVMITKQAPNYQGDS